jgi:BolA protein
MSGVVEADLVTRLRGRFDPTHLEVLNESHQHSVPANSETHFKVVIVSARFEPMSRVARHRAIHDAVGSLLSEGIHALSIQAHTPEQWRIRGGAITPSPACRGGSKSA